MKAYYLYFFFQTAEALACQVTQEHYDKGMTFPPFSNIRTISANIAAKVAAKAYDLGWYLLYHSLFIVHLFTILKHYSLFIVHFFAILKHYKFDVA